MDGCGSLADNHATRKVRLLALLRRVVACVGVPAQAAILERARKLGWRDSAGLCPSAGMRLCGTHRPVDLQFWPISVSWESVFRSLLSRKAAEAKRGPKGKAKAAPAKAKPKAKVKAKATARATAACC